MANAGPEPAKDSAAAFRLGTHRFSVDTRQLQDTDGNLVDLRSQSADVLAVLLRNNKEIVSKETLFDEVWGETVVTEGSLVQCISDIRRAIKDIDHKIVQTMPKKGYRILGETIPQPETSGDSDQDRYEPRRASPWIAAAIAVAAMVIAVGAFLYWPSSDEPIAPLPTGPRLAIVPFATPGEQAEDRQLAAAMTEDLATNLSRFTSLFVLSLNATAAYKGRPVDPRQIGRELGVQYVLEGSAWRADENLRVTLKLLDAETAERIWSETYDRDLTARNVFAILDDVTSAMAATIASNTGVLTVREGERIAAGRPETLSAYECTALVAWFRASLSPERRAAIRTCLEQSVIVDPNYSRAWSELANILIETYKNETFTAAQADALLERADAAANRATQVDRGNEMGYYLRAIVAQLRGEDYETFKGLADKALAVNPNNANVVGDIGNFTFYYGDWERGKKLVARMMELNPSYPSWAHFVFFLDHFNEAEYDAALAEVLKITLSEHCMIQWAKAAAYGKVGEVGKGKGVLRHIETIEPKCPNDPREPFVKRRLPDDLVASIYDGLIRAGFTAP